MIRVKVQNFQNLHIQDDSSNTLKILFVRDPYAYFDYLLSDYLRQKYSILFTEDIDANLKNMNSESFLKWLHTLNFIPFYNPQTFQLDVRKRLNIAIENLEQFDYVVPYEEIDLFLENVATDMTIEEEKQVSFTPNLKSERTLMEVFIDKDLKLYERSLELWDLIKKNNFKPLGTLIERKQRVESTEDQKDKMAMNKYKGVAGQITATSIKGWVFHEEKEEIIMLEIYKNNDLVCVTRADQTRNDLKQRNIHPTGKCGFEAIFDNPTFKEGDQIEIKILPDNISLPFGPNIKKFLEGKN